MLSFRHVWCLRHQTGGFLVHPEHRPHFFLQQMEMFQT